MPTQTPRNSLARWEAGKTSTTGRDAADSDGALRDPILTGGVENRRLLKLYGLVLLVAWLLLVGSAWHGARYRGRPDRIRFAQSVPPLAAARAAALCERLAHGSPLALNVWRAERRAWVADWTDGRGEPAGTFYWDGTTGELSYASVPGRATPGGGPRVSGAQATRAARAWLGELRLGTTGGARPLSWVPDGPPLRSPGDWLVRWRAGDRRALVHVDAHTGVPTSAACRHLAVRG